VRTIDHERAIRIQPTGHFTRNRVKGNMNGSRENPFLQLIALADIENLWRVLPSEPFTDSAGSTLFACELRFTVSVH